MASEMEVVWAAMRVSATAMLMVASMEVVWAAMRVPATAMLMVPASADV